MSSPPITWNESLPDAAERVAGDLRMQADAEEWGTQGAVAAWLRILADRLDEAVLRDRKRGEKADE